MANNRIETLRAHFKVPRELTITVKFIDHDMKNFETFDPTTGNIEIVEMQEFYDGLFGQYYRAGYASSGQCLYIRDELLAPDVDQHHD